MIEFLPSNFIQPKTTKKNSWDFHSYLKGANLRVHQSLRHLPGSNCVAVDLRFVIVRYAAIGGTRVRLGYLDTAGN